ncbi:MAG: Rrf2 family transcriptional regulator [Spirochaetales bacterium]|jgi:Rrf2 family iron-sulfur cluster assembly transcriptional regulator|nr:Rrf2 family transcriptional regulator [Spirochaetales bacterium]
MKITTKGRYGLRAVINLASRDAGALVSIRSIAEEEGIPQEFLEQIFFKLRKKGIVSSSRGAGGGFRMALLPEEISVLDILDAAGEEISLSPCSASEKTCQNFKPCAALDIWVRGTEMIRDYFKNISVRDIIEKSVPGL